MDIGGGMPDEDKRTEAEQQAEKDWRAGDLSPLSPEDSVPKKRPHMLMNMGAVGTISFALIVVSHYFAIIGFLDSIMGSGLLTGAICAFFVVAIPFVGSICAFIGALNAWDWSIELAGAVFILFPLAWLVVSAVFGAKTKVQEVRQGIKDIQQSIKDIQRS